MDDNMINNIANKIASDDSNEPLKVIDAQVDIIIEALSSINDAIKKLSLTPEETEKVNKIKDALENGVSPYIADIAQTLDSLEVE